MFQVEICSQQIEICKSVCMFIVLAIIDFRLFCSNDCRSLPREETINNHGCWGKHAHIPDNDYWGICLFHVVWTNFFLQLFLCGTHGIYIFCFSSTEHCAWAIISSKEFKYCVTRISFALLPGWQNYLMSNILRFALKISFWVDF
jgi:hypothetical protein